MIRINEIQDKLLHLIGWRQEAYNPDLEISENLTQSESGMFFQQIHPLLTLQNLRSISPEFTDVVYPDYSVSSLYVKGDLISYNGVIYKALQDVPLNYTPDSYSEYWVKTNPFSEWLEEKIKASILKAILRFCNDKYKAGTAKPLCENRVLFDNTGRITDTEPNKNNLVGFEIVPIRAKGVSIKINKIGLQFTEAGEYTIYLMNSGSEVPVKTMTFVKQKNNTMEWFPISDLVLPYIGDDIDAGGSWYLCYRQSSLHNGSKAIRKNRDWSKKPCSACSKNEYISWKAWSPYIEIHPFYLNEELLQEEDPQTATYIVHEVPTHVVCRNPANTLIAGAPIAFGLDYVMTNPALRFEWDFGDGTPLDDTYAFMLQHTYASPGMYEVIFRVYLGNDLISTSTTNITINS